MSHSLPRRALLLLLLALAAPAIARSGHVAAQSLPGSGVRVTAYERLDDGSLRPLSGVTLRLVGADNVADIVSDDAGAAVIQAGPNSYGLLAYRDGYDGVAAIDCAGATVGAWDTGAQLDWGSYHALWRASVSVAPQRYACLWLLFAAEPAPPQPPAPAPPPSATPASQHTVYLTFDDGYLYLCETVDLVRSLNLHATFFLTGQAMLAAPACVQQLLADGDHLGNHTYAHENLTRLSAGQITTTLQRTEDAAQAVAGVSTKPLCRPPYGAINASVRAVATAWGCTMYLWNIDTRDWAGLSPASIEASVESARCNGDIILLHTQAFPRDRIALPAAVQTLRARGCDFSIL